MSEQDTKARDRSPNYPYLSLSQAIDRARQFYEAEKRGRAAVQVVAKHWGYSPKSSGLLQSIAALKAYGLMEEEGRGETRRVKLSERALRVILDNRPHSVERIHLLREAAMQPPVAQKISEAFPGGLPSPHNLEHFLIFDLKFTPDSAKSAVKTYSENSMFTGAYADATISELSESLREDMPETSTQTPPRRTVQEEIHGSGTANSVENIIGPTGNIVVQFMGEPTLDAYAFLEDYIKLRKNVLTRAPAYDKDKDEKKEEG